MDRLSMLNRGGKMEIRKKDLTILNGLRYVWLLLHTIVVIVWCFSTFAWFDYFATLTAKLFRPDIFIDTLMQGLCTTIMWLMLLIIIFKLFADIKKRYCLFITNETIAEYIERRLHRDRRYKNELLDKLQSNGIMLVVNEVDDFISKVKYKVCLNDIEIYRITFQSSSQKELKVKEYVSYEVLAYLYFAIRKYGKIIEASRSQERKEKEGKEKIDLEDTVFHKERKSN